MPSLGKVGIADRGTYSSTETYNSGDFVLYGGSTWLCLVDNLTGFEPIEGSENWKYLARGFAAEMLSVITAIDTYGMVGEAGGETDAQTFMDKLADEVANKLVKKTSIVSTHSTSTETVPSSALVNDLNSNLGQKLPMYISIPDGITEARLLPIGYYRLNSSQFSVLTDIPSDGGGGSGFILIDHRDNDERVVIISRAEKGRLCVGHQYGYSTGETLVWETNATTSDLDKHTLDIIELSTEEEINNFYNTYSDNFKNNTKYGSYTTHAINHPILGGGAYYLEGFKNTANYEYQKVTSYNNNSGIIRQYVRSKYGGSWSTWTAEALKSDLKESFCGAFSGKKYGDIVTLSKTVTRNSYVFINARYNSNSDMMLIFNTPTINAGENSFSVLAFDVSTGQPTTHTNICGIYQVVPI